MTGVDSRRHLPRLTSGCYYERLEDCCWLCTLRLVFDTIHRTADDSGETADRQRVGIDENGTVHWPDSDTETRSGADR